MTTSNAETITRSSKSNLALAFIALPPERRRDITTFYAFCRMIDDIADEPGPSPAEKTCALAAWKRALCKPFAGEPALAAEVRALIAKYHLNENLLLQLIQGCEMDLTPVRYETWDDLLRYCYHVASVVGLVSIEIFGYRNPATRRYAVELGYALQLTNIFYLQTQSSSSSTNPQTTSTDSSSVQLIKLGDEVHGPEDSMVIEKSQVLFYENLKSDGKVAQSIAAYQKAH